jgi:hypothetical protein
VISIAFSMPLRVYLLIAQVLRLLGISRRPDREKAPDTDDLDPEQGHFFSFLVSFIVLFSYCSKPVETNVSSESESGVKPVHREKPFASFVHKARSFSPVCSSSSRATCVLDATVPSKGPTHRSGGLDTADSL